MKNISNIDKIMQCRLDTFRKEMRKYLAAIKEIENEYGLKAGEDIIEEVNNNGN